MSAHNWVIAEAVRPRSKLTTIDEWLHDMNRPDKPWQVRVMRVPEEPTPYFSGVTIAEREAVQDIVLNEYIGIKYPISVIRLGWYRFFNNLPFRIKGKWCTKVAWEPWERVCPGVLDRIPDGKRKKNPTPRTFEKRAFAGNLVDVTSQIFPGVPGMFRVHFGAILPGDILCATTHTAYGKAIQAVLSSVSNHNAVFVKP